MADLHDRYPAGTPVVTADGHTVGTVRAAYSHFLQVTEANGNDRNVPARAIDRIEEGTLHLKVNLDALTEVEDAAAFVRTHPDEDA
ncbi:MAG: hypothetical protein AVDCRST_MAG49-3685 [uncultured Thermomicrobiales bacterium]|uniref:DUF2171 domain-containing protein n=1 Tax=uncultured Thermomicrobiales bacterium TaxID=1645740 RepID=A0A6J4V8G9_9BACT|nr:MAG: hypothetical protein AVDCRST_MAG49-3685 [uncultured Thermomicrobiales bacterium]